MSLYKKAYSSRTELVSVITNDNRFIADFYNGDRRSIFKISQIRRI